MLMFVSGVSVPNHVPIDIQLAPDEDCEGPSYKQGWVSSVGLGTDN